MSSKVTLTINPTPSDATVSITGSQLNTTLDVVSSNSNLSISNNYDDHKSSTGIESEVLTYSSSVATLPSADNWQSVCYNTFGFNAIASDSNKSAHSSDGISWSAYTSLQSYKWSSICGDGGNSLVAVALNSNKMAYSFSSGMLWSEYTLPSTLNWNSVCYGNGKFVAVASGTAIGTGSSTATYSTNGTTWTASTMPSSSAWSSVCYGNGKFVAISGGINNTSYKAAYSTDGINWTASTLPSKIQWKSVCYGNGKFVAVSYISSVAAYSTDGVNWTETTLPSSASWYSVCYDNGKFVAVANSSNKAAYSTDGIDWTASTLPMSANWRSICYGNGKFVAVAAGSDKAAYSTDGINWSYWTNSQSQEVTPEDYSISVSGTPSTGNTLNLTYTTTLQPVTQTGNQATVWDGTTLNYSVSKQYYTTQTGTKVMTTVGETIPVSLSYIPVTCTRDNSKDIEPIIYTQTETPLVNNDWWFSNINEIGEKIGNVSANVNNWVESTMPSLAGWYSVCYGNGKFVAITYDSNKAAYSEDGINWTASTLPSSGVWYSVCYGNGKFVTVGGRDGYERTAYSEDGINWTASTLPEGGYWESVCYGNGKFVAVGGNNKSERTAYSTDGINWTASTLPSTGSWYSVCYGNGKFVALVYGKVAYSTNGIDWSELALPALNNAWSSVCYGNGKFVAVGGSNGSEKAAYSTDGTNWTVVTLPATSGAWSSVCYGDGKFVAIAGGSSGSNKAIYSTDGISWTQFTLPSSTHWYSICYGNEKFVAVATSFGKAAYTLPAIVKNSSTYSRLPEKDTKDKITSFFFTIKTDQYTEGNKTFYLPIGVATGYVNPITIDWGDGNAEVISSGTFIQHDYATAGTYQIRVYASTGKMPYLNGINNIAVACKNIGYQIESLDSAYLAQYITPQVKFTGINGVASLSHNNRYADSFCTTLYKANPKMYKGVMSPFALKNSFTHCWELTSFELDELTEVQQEGLAQAFADCIALKSLSLKNLVKIGVNGCDNLVQGSTNLEYINLDNLQEIGAYGLYNGFYNCSKLASINLNKVSVIGANGLQGAFHGCTSLTSLSFPALKSTSFGSYTNQFNNMLQGVTGCTVHFPSNLQAVIGTWSDIQNGFGGTNTVVLFDLPATN